MAQGLKTRIHAAAYLWVVALATFIPLLTALGYSSIQAETLVVTLALALISFLLACLLSHLPKAFDTLLALLVYWLADTFLPGGKIGSIIAAVLAFGVHVGLKSRLSENVRRMLLVFCLVWLTGSQIGTSTPSLNPPLPASAASTNSTLRPIVHIVLDEQMSPRTLPETIPAGHPALSMLDDYRARGFDIFSHARSQSSNTQVSLSRLLLLEDSNNHTVGQVSGFTYEVLENRYHARLREQGYSVTIVQSNFLRLCPPTDSDLSCHSYTRGNNGDAMRRFPGNLSQRMGALLQEIHSTYIRMGGANDVVFYWLPLGLLQKAGLISLPGAHFYTRPALMLELFEEIQPRLANITLGEAYFLHFLLPHFPYMLDTQCRLKPAPQWSAPNRYSHQPKPELQIYADYWDQSACTHKRVMALIDAISEQANAQPVIYIHGDHGSRISGKTTTGNSPDMLETFLAVRDNDTQGREHQSVEELQSLFVRLFADSDRRR